MSSIGESPFRVNTTWEWETEDEAVPFNRMPIHRFRNYRGRGDYEMHLGTLDRINDKIVNEMTIAKVQAFRQRAIKGLPDTEKRVVDGKLVEQAIDYEGVFEAAPGSLWQVPGDVEFWESSAVDLTPIRMAIKDDLERLAAVTSTSLHTVTPDAASGSAEGASLMRETSVDAANTRIDHADRPWCEVMATLLRVHGRRAPVRPDTDRVDLGPDRTVQPRREGVRCFDGEDNAAGLGDPDRHLAVPAGRGGEPACSAWRRTDLPGAGHHPGAGGPAGCPARRRL